MKTKDFLLNHLGLAVRARAAVASLILQEGFIGTDPSRGPERNRERALTFTPSFGGGGARVRRETAGVLGGK